MVQLKALSEGDVLKAIADRATLINIVTEASFENYFISGHYVIPFIPESMHFLEVCIPKDQAIIIGNEEDANLIGQRFTELGYSNILGHSAFDIHKFILDQPDVDLIMNIDLEEFGIDCKHEKDAAKIDLREVDECAEGYVKDALNIPIALIKEKASALGQVKQVYLYCSDGFRSMLASCILKNNNIHHFKNVLLGFKDFDPEHITITKPKKN